MSPGFSYSGDNGPDKWGSLSPSYETCQSGKSQSPIDIPDEDKMEANKDLKSLGRDYKVVNASLINRRFYVELNLGNAGGFNFQEKDYTFKQINFHTPSEHTIDGKQYDAESQLFHVATDGSRIVIAVLYKIGNADPLLAKMQNQLVELAKEQCGSNEVSQIAVKSFNAPKLERGTRKYYHYVGSLTTPPCTENIKYVILGKVRSISKEQVALLKAPLDSKCKGNSRPVQPLNDRHVDLYSESD
ncbi:alpha carbonic anhydrase 1, chloroplastic-like isoform X2 [Impatiens glandulifera]|nr:alpha carbonic anhydrase 1, chloroplastic-like isoform X2 [Impatiens glandulifera]